MHASCVRDENPCFRAMGVHRAILKVLSRRRRVTQRNVQDNKKEKRGKRKRGPRLREGPLTSANLEYCQSNRLHIFS